MARAIVILALFGAALPLAGQHHYVFFNRDRERIAEESFLGATAAAGAQLKYTWSELEPARGQYRFEPVRQDLDFLRSRGKRLFIQLQDVSFDGKIRNVPKDIAVAPQHPAGWVPRRWDPAVRARFHQLLSALGREFDGRIEGINLPETSIDLTGTRPDGFTPERYRDAVLDTMAALKRAFPHSVAMQYANFMPGEWLPGEDRGLLKSVYREAVRLGVAVGGPDLLPFRRGQLAHSYPLIRAASGKVPTGIAVQTGNYEHPNGVPGLLRFAREDLRVDYIFWCTQEPYYSKQVLPLLRVARPE